MLMIVGSTALLTGDVVEKPLLIDTCSMGPSELIRKWMYNCVSCHDTCRTSFAGEPLDGEKLKISPRRLIQTFTKNNSELKCPRLIEPGENFTHSYVALSHCWGSPDKRPLCTTRANLSQHMTGIPWEGLPQTFRDSISICIELSIQYLWIDSICIVQDDASEWRHESVIMGSIYEQAFFTIAASSAINSIQGLFKVRSTLNLVELPYRNADGTTDRVFAYIEPELEKDLSSAPLSDRAWVMQEYYLSRRTVHFTTNGLIWSCKNGRNPRTRYMTSEFGDSWEKAFEEDWITLVGSYTRRRLTYNSDKLIAMQGMTDRFNQVNRKSYYYGLWIEDLPHDLLWYSDERLIRNVRNGIPSWTWASTTGRISFKSSVFENLQPYHVEIIPVMDSIGSLRIRSVLKRVDNLEGPLQCQAFCFEDLQDMGFTGRLHEDYKNGNILVSPTFLLSSSMDRMDKVGWGVFDEYERPPGSIFCLPLLKQRVWEGFAQSKEQFFLWVLLVRAVTDVDKFERVGWGLLLVPSWLDGVAERNVYLL